MMAHDAVESRAAAIQLQPTAQCQLFDFFSTYEFGIYRRIVLKVTLWAIVRTHKLKKTYFEKLCIGFRKGRFQLRQILGLIGIALDASVVCIMKFSTLFKFPMAILSLWLPCPINLGNHSTFWNSDIVHCSIVACAWNIMAAIWRLSKLAMLLLLYSY